MTTPINTAANGVDVQRLVRQVYKSDRTDEHEPPENATHLKTLCTGCQKPIDCYWPPTTTFAGKICTAEEYMAKALQSENVGIYCDDCMERMPDVKLGDLRFEPNAPAMASADPKTPTTPENE